MATASFVDSFFGYCPTSKSFVAADDPFKKTSSLYLPGGPSFRLRNVELRFGVAGWRDRLGRFVDDLSVLVGPMGLHLRRVAPPAVTINLYTPELRSRPLFN